MLHLHTHTWILSKLMLPNTEVVILVYFMCYLGRVESQLYSDSKIIKLQEQLIELRDIKTLPSFESAYENNHYYHQLQSIKTSSKILDQF